MSSGNKRPVVRVTYSYKDGDTWRNFSILSVWAKDHAGLYRLSLDKGSEKYPAINFIDALKRFAAGTGAIEVSIESQREQRGPGGQRQYTPPAQTWDSGDDGFGGSDVPF